TGGATDGGTTGGTTGGGTTGGGTTGGGTTGGGTTGGATDGGTTGGTTGGGTTGGANPFILADAGGPYAVFAGEAFAFDGSGSILMNVDPALLQAEWLLNGTTLLATGLGTTQSPLQPALVTLDMPGQFQVLLRLTHLGLMSEDLAMITVLAREIPVPATILLLATGMVCLHAVRRRRRARRAPQP
ncbi:MAG: PEP-CTERM sorting domain-containing protein, partial [Alphaproteobacteria bacterium]